MFDSVTSLLLRHDPIGIKFGNHTCDEPEAETTLPRLNHCSSSKDVFEAVHQELVRWFGEDTADPQEGNLLRIGGLGKSARRTADLIS